MLREMSEHGRASPSVFIYVGPETIGRTEEAAAEHAGVGAVAEFRGLVRGEEAGAVIGGLVYEAYQPMAERQIARIVAELAEKFPVAGVRVVHRIGRVPVGDAAIYVRVTAKHRAEAFALLAGFMDRLKQDVPIWKTGIF
jgi:molybdopterin synthase catalytic subunit